jgi:twinkle protein
VIIVEGELDKLSLEEAGYRNVVSVPSGALPPRRVSAAAGGGAPAAPAGHRQLDAKFAFVARAEAALAGAAILLAVDADAPGLALAEELARRLGRGRCRLLRWPTGCKDANDFLMGADLAAAGLEGGGEPNPGRLCEYVRSNAVPMPPESLV